MPALYIPQLEYPEDGFDLYWELATDGPLPVPIAYYGNKCTGGNTWFDASGLGNDGAISGNCAWDVSHRGAVINFPDIATGDYVPTGLASVDNSLMTVACWHRTSSGNSGVLTGKTASGAPYKYFAFVVEQAATKSYMYMGNGASFESHEIEASSALTDGEWHHFAYVRDGANGWAYLDGELFPLLATKTNWSLDATCDLDIGSYSYRRANGDTNGVAYWDQALSASQVLDLYRSQIRGGPGVLGRSWPRCFPVAGAAAGFVPYPYPLHELSGGVG